MDYGLWIMDYGLWIELIYLVLIADFLSGVGHWFEDTYGNPNWWLIGKYVIQPNLEHHKNPRQFTKQSYFKRNDTSIIGAAILGFMFWGLGFLTWQVGFVLLLLSQINEVHAHAHRLPYEYGNFEKALAWCHLLQSRQHHSVHHNAPFDCRFCILTNALNPILDRYHFWQFLENVIDKILKIKALRGSEVRGGI